jgi:hypothetical protein
MKNLLYVLPLLPALAHGSFSKPELLARFMFSGAWNAPDNTWCFGGEPVGLRGRAYLNCLDSASGLMASFGKEGPKILARVQADLAFSKPVISSEKVHWYEFSELTSTRAYSANPTVSKIEIGNLGPFHDSNDSFLPFSANVYFFKSKGSKPELWFWQNNVVTSFFHPQASYIFYPVIGARGEIAVKTRQKDLEESSPDKLWHFRTQWRVFLEDRDSNPSSPWLGFRHQVAVDGDRILVIARDRLGEVLLLVEEGRTKMIAREGVELKRFDYFSPKMRAGVIVVRGEDFQGNKVTYVKDQGSFRPLLAQGDIIQTDLGPGRVFYQNPNALFYGAPGLDEEGNIYLQATLTDPDYPQTLLGVGLIKFNKE